MNNKIFNNVIGVVFLVLGEYYFSYLILNLLFMELGVSGEVFSGNCEIKCSNWFKVCNEDDLVDVILVLGIII